MLINEQQLREYIESTEEAVTVKITDGSFGMSNDTKKFYPIQETGLGVEDLDFKPLGDDYPGRWGVVINKTRPGVTVDQLLLLQRSNISDDLAGHIADILTTKAKLKGRELTPQQRREFFENFINNDFEEGEITSPDK
ncbi:MAG: hypothetical protein EBU08_09190, partial [Micrococcales bacterium]|nr:hypothetical protein [Micrococcales bacterium]